MTENIPGSTAEEWSAFCTIGRLPVMRMALPRLRLGYARPLRRLRRHLQLSTGSLICSAGAATSTP